MPFQVTTAYMRPRNPLRIYMMAAPMTAAPMKIATAASNLPEALVIMSVGSVDADAVIKANANVRRNTTARRNRRKDRRLFTSFITFILFVRPGQ